jgi:hypothetical protein
MLFFLAGCATLAWPEACVYSYVMTAAVMTAFLYIRVYRANMFIFLIFKALYNSTAYVVTFNQLKVIS